ncbi:MAG: hypothetical protein M3Q10_04110 [Chloroflexota bacterium]|nr:hypothetical protein [Chloroflexota bacterium]
MSIPVQRRRAEGVAHPSQRALTIGQVAARLAAEPNDGRTYAERRRDKDGRLRAMWRDVAIEAVARLLVLEEWAKDSGGRAFPAMESLRCSCPEHRFVRNDVLAQARRLVAGEAAKVTHGGSECA